MTKQKLCGIIERVSGRLGYIAPENCFNLDDMYSWEWHQGVGLYGMYRYYLETKRKDVLEGIIHWYEENIRRGLPEHNVNSTCPLFTLMYVYEETGDERYLKICMDWAEWVMHELPKTEEGIFQHTVFGGDNHNQVWDDTLFMAVLFLAKMGVFLGREDYIAECVYQFLEHLKYLTDNETGLLFHGWTFEGRHNFARARWARGNCWLTAVIVEFLDIVPNLDKGVRRFLITALNEQVKTLVKFQETDGMWHTLIDDPSSYVETSATAGFGYGILKGVRKGYLAPAYEEAGLRAVSGVLSNIAQNGDVLNVSYGTGMGDELEDYKKIPIVLQPFGQALTILLLTEYMQDVHFRTERMPEVKPHVFKATEKSLV